MMYDVPNGDMATPDAFKLTAVYADGFGIASIHVGLLTFL